MVIAWKEWNDEECLEAWRTLRNDHQAIELLYALYGGLLSGELKFSGNMCSIKRHCQPAAHVQFELGKAEEVCEDSITFAQPIPVQTIRDMANLYEFEQGDRSKEIYSKDDLKHIRAQFYLECSKK